ncbi:hypothetical protein FHG87_005781 [Trinorchestia longiramus]|nr:hypothetical protein FHG87_005781 [Trinorchestia longiramus]
MLRARLSPGRPAPRVLVSTESCWSGRISSTRAEKHQCFWHQRLPSVKLNKRGGRNPDREKLKFTHSQRDKCTTDLWRSNETSVVNIRDSVSKHAAQLQRSGCPQANKLLRLPLPTYKLPRLPLPARKLPQLPLPVRKLLLLPLPTRKLPLPARKLSLLSQPTHKLPRLLIPALKLPLSELKLLLLPQTVRKVPLSARKL